MSALKELFPPPAKFQAPSDKHSLLQFRTPNINRSKLSYIEPSTISVNKLFEHHQFC